MIFEQPTLRDVQAPSTNLAELWTDAPAPQTNAPVARTDGPTPTVPPAAQPRSASMGADAVAVRRLRDGTGAPILLVHGFGADANGWRPLLPSLTTSRPVIGLDLPGHGGSPAGDAAALDDLVEVAGSAAAAYGPLHVVAHSLGAAVMTVVAERGLADIRSLLLLSPAGLGPDINGPFMQGFLAGSSEASLTPWLRELVADPEAITPAFVRATLKARDSTDRVAAQRRLADALFPDGTQAFSIRAKLRRLALPIRVVFGTADRIIPARHAAILPPLAALHLLASVGHMPHLEASGTVAAILGQMATT